MQQHYFHTKNQFQNKNAIELKMSLSQNFHFQEKSACRHLPAFNNKIELTRNKPDKAEIMPNIKEKLFT